MGWPKRSLIQALDDLRQKDLDIRRLTIQIARLQTELQKQHSPAPHSKKQCVDLEVSPDAPAFNWKDILLECFRSN
ncbi:hypothetical protein HA466_0208520 [Hirschfeldia incana]|nr:hypothetical protein HA466_0208520 [Hirschfeldia incana]